MAKKETLAVRLEPETKEALNTIAAGLGFSQGELISRLINRVKDDKEFLNSLRPVIK